MKFENIYKDTEENVRLALLSLWTPGTHPMRPVIEDLFHREPLMAEPVFQSTFGWEMAETENWKSAIDTEVWNRLERARENKARDLGKTFRPFVPFKHQAKSWVEAAKGNSIVVTSGTGSGKTECFMYPVISDLYKQGDNNAIEAIFLYPLNALMEDQKERLRDCCQATGLRFAVYNGNTPERREVDPADVEVKTRERIRDRDHRGTRPHILLTNPSMLEYILVREKDQQMLQESAGKLRWIVIDEAHSYSGSAAVELAYQIKRILDAFNVDAKDVRFACTSATISGTDGEKSLAEFISSITGQTLDQIRIIGGNRLVPALDRTVLAEELQKIDGRPDVDKVLSLRCRINEVSSMTLSQMWKWLFPTKFFGTENVWEALRMLDALCDIKVNDIPVLSLRGHFFMRTINGLYACANPDCKEANEHHSLYGRMTTYKASSCPVCGAPLLDVLQCKQCRGFVLVGKSDANSHQITPLEDLESNDDYFLLEDEEDNTDADDAATIQSSDTFFLLPYDKQRFYNPVSSAHFESVDIVRQSSGISKLQVNRNDNGRWVEVRRGATHSYCPSCGKLAVGMKMNFKYFRIPVNFINPVIAPVFLKESAAAGNPWGKYIAFTDSRQGTAISAKTFNIAVERLQCNKAVVKALVNRNLTQEERLLQLCPNCTPEQMEQLRNILLPVPNNTPEISLSDLSEIIYNESLYQHLANGNDDGNVYKAALMRNFIGRRPLYESNAETMGFISISYSSLANVSMPGVLSDYIAEHDLNVNVEDWRNFLKIALDYCVRMGNHIQPPIAGEIRYVRDNNRGFPIVAENWPTIRMTDNCVARKQHRLTTLLCAGLGIHTYQALLDNTNIIGHLLTDAWEQLVKWCLTRNDNNESYYLDLSNHCDNIRVRRLESAWMCPVTYQLLDAVFCGYSPLINGELNEKLFEKFKCSPSKIQMPCPPQNDDEVERWLQDDRNIDNMKQLGLWSDRYQYVYERTPVYIAAEHSAQQSRNLLRQYTDEFRQNPPAINVLHCSTTMEMGVDIGDIDIVLMGTVPPTSANYLQRVGRAGRAGQTKSVAFSLCNNTPVGQKAFSNPGWALQCTQYMSQVHESRTIIQRHINSYFFRRFICTCANGIDTMKTVGSFMQSMCDHFINYLTRISTDQEEVRRFRKIFGYNPYTVEITSDSIQTIRTDFNAVVSELQTAFDRYRNDDRRSKAIIIQRTKFEEENLLIYLSKHQFIPNANMPTGIVTFDFMDKRTASRAYEKTKEIRKLKDRLEQEQDPMYRADLENQLNQSYQERDKLYSNTSASRDIRTALNEYAPGQTVVIDERNYMSAGVTFFGEYNDATQTRAIYFCKHCGHTEYRAVLDEHAVCPVCGQPYHGIINSNNSAFTLAYEPIGFRIDQNENANGEEVTSKQYYDIRPVLLHTDWSRCTELNMCETINSGETGNILFYNVGRGNGFAFCKYCGRTALEEYNNDDIPRQVQPGHHVLWYGGRDCCNAQEHNIARHVVFTGVLHTCYTVLRFKQDFSSPEFMRDRQFVYSMGVVLKRALVQREGIDESEIDFGIKQESNAWLLFIYDTAKGGCGYSLRLSRPDYCQEVFGLALKNLVAMPCKCHEEENGACTQCLVDRNNYRYSNLLSKKKVLDWLTLQNEHMIEVPQYIRQLSPSAQVAYQPIKDIIRQAVESPDVQQITLYVSDEENTAVSDWLNIHSEMGKNINDALRQRIGIELIVEYHPDLHSHLSEKLPFVAMRDKFTNCSRVCFIKDMGPVKTIAVINSGNEVQHYFTDDSTALSFSENWGEGQHRIFFDGKNVAYEEQEEPVLTEDIPTQIIRDGLVAESSFEIQNYFTVVMNSVLDQQDKNMLSEVLNDRHVSITFSDMYVNSALASLMLVYMIREIKDIYRLHIDKVVLQLDSPRRRCVNERFNEYHTINMNFSSKEESDRYTESLFIDILDVYPVFSNHDAAHHRWLRIETSDGGFVEIRPDHGISGGYKSVSLYRDLDLLDGRVSVTRNPYDDILFYFIIDRSL